MNTTDKLKKTMLMALRCGYVSLGKGGRLTDKGQGLWGPKIWRIIYRVQCFFTPSKRQDMYNVLDSISRLGRINELNGVEDDFVIYPKHTPNGYTKE